MRVSVNSVDTTVRVRVDNVTNRVTAKVFQGRKGDTGPTGPQGPAGPNEITSATTTNFTSGNVLFANSGVVGSLSRSGIDTRTSFPNDDVTAASTSGANNALVRFTANGDIGLVGNTRTISVVNTLGTNEVSILAGGITLTGGSGIQSTGANAVITTTGANGRIFTTGANAHIETTNSGAYIQTRNSFRYFDTPTGSVMTLAFASLTTNRTITFPNSSGTVALTSDIPTLGTGVATFLATPTSANLAAAVSDETGTGSLVFANSPTLTTPNIAQINGGTAANDDLTLQGTTNATRTTSYVIIQPNGGNVGINTSTPSHALQVFGTSGRVAVMGDVGASTGTTTPVNVSFGSTFGTNTPGTVGNLKWDLFTSSSSGSRYGIGMSAGLMEFQAGPSGGHGFYVNQGTLALFVSSTAEVGIGTATPSSRAILDLTSTTKGFLPPRMTTAQRDAITSVPAGLMIYNTSTNKLNFYNGSAWEVVTSS